jgi:hydroxypyruvate isomerase
VIRWSAHLSMLFRELPYLERPGAAAAAGFTAVETWWPGGNDAHAWAGETVRLGLDVSLLNAYGGDIEAGERGFLNVPERRGEAVAAVREAIEVAGRCGGQRINVLVGRELPGVPLDEQLAHAVGVLRECAGLAADAGLTVLVEPINALDVPRSLLPTPGAAAELIEAVQAENVRLLYDAYHVARGGGDPVREVESLAPLIGHVQYADCPGRGAPGTGDIDLCALVEALEGVGYDGAVGLELDPNGSSERLLELVPR